MSEPSSTGRIKRRYLTSLAVQLGVAGVFIALISSGTFSISGPPAPVVERQLIPSRPVSAADKVSSPVTLESLVAQAESVGLSGSQLKDIERLRLEKSKELAIIDKELEAAISAFNLRFKNRTDKERADFATIEKAAAPATELGRKRRLTIDAFDRQGFNVLNAEQKVQALKLTAKSLERRAGGGDR
ncbi:MAG: hypothetical protein H6677_06935 [Candidatus Obscuribacterales bacterium]|nr:hypothetical protein [Cyanobacteria bacterium HKST-UBA01]MCB9467998.1 hypothetical protein [Candidatus Obscuribacterales bacterium]